jgi:AraC-like DNA-binding protein
MIVAQISDPYLAAALSRAVHPEEDLFLEEQRVREALNMGYPRLLVRTSDGGTLDPDGDVPVVVLSHATLRTWEAQRRMMELPPSRVEHLAGRLRGLLERRAAEVTWVDRTLAELERAAGAALPPGLRGFARRVLEFPSYYDDLRPLADVCGVSRGALKARFRRRDLPSPYSYLRWFRVMACAHLLADRSITVAQTARRLGFTSDGNLCRTMDTLTGFTPTELRSARGWKRLVIRFSVEHLNPAALHAWGELEELFIRRAG